MVTTVAAILGVIAVPPDRLPITLAITAPVIAWSVAQIPLYCRAGGRRWTVPAVDMAVLAGVCLTQRWTVPAGNFPHANTWVCIVVSIGIFALQWQGYGWAGVLAGLALAGTDALGVALTGPPTWRSMVAPCVYMPVEIMLTVIVLWLLAIRSIAVERSIAAAAAERETAAVSAARRAAERLHLAQLHDTACSTLMMATTVRGAADLAALRAQAGMDLLRLRADSGLPPEMDLTESLRQEIQRHPLAVRSQLRASVVIAPQIVTALTAAVGEALRNVCRHSGTDQALVRLSREPGRVQVEIIDAGRGFEPAEVSAFHQGLIWSIQGRIAAIGGSALIDSTPGHGTTVRLEVPDAG
ncbi:hypothetical protein D5S17_30680 [Pseudonocardiaceae bacterium YIM PH 21723]|nr:hypothetical protein D5S17_30680 [Pseudonocardiaceae bacterium YIM PH 21723]